jgi:PIN domain nuclease of toxin-antitoxin system
LTTVPPPPLIEVLDSSAVLAFLRAEPGGDLVRDILSDPSFICYAHVINITEVIYDLHRSGGEDHAQRGLQLLSPHVIFYSELPDELWLDAGRLKSVYRRISMADCFLLALARILGGEVITADHHEFDRLVPLGICNFRFIR